MSRACQFAFAGRSGPAEWSFDETELVVYPAGGQPMVFAVKELAGIAGDGYAIDLTVPGPGVPTDAETPGIAAPAAADASPVLSLSKLGAEGPTLMDGLRRSWIVARAQALRLGGSGEGKPFSGMVAGLEVPGPKGPVASPAAGSAAGSTAGAAAGPPVPFQALLFEDVMVVAREGRDLDPVFIALMETIAFDEVTYSIRVTEWPSREIVFSRLGKQTDEFLDALGRRRQVLAAETAATLASAAPSLPQAYRGTLAGEWPPGRMRTLQDLDALCPGFEQEFRATWLPACARKDEGLFLLDWAGPAACRLGCSRETAESGETLLWMLAEKGGTWFLEALTGEDRATYRFSGDRARPARGSDVAGLPALASRLLCAPQFSREALYGTPDMLTGDRADLAIAARFLGFLVALRAAFEGRVIHTSPESWRMEMEAAAAEVAPSPGAPRPQ